MPSDWVVVQPSVKPITDKIEPVLNPVISIIDVTIKVLNIVQTILNIVKSFLIGILDPLRPLLEAIIAEIKALISDLRQLGFYLHGDWDLFDSKTYYADLLGGYSAYEQRMLGRLLDTTDPNRPDFSPQSSVIGLFLFANSGDIGLLIEIIKQIADFFGQKDLMGNSQPFPPPQTPEILYSSENFIGLPLFVGSDKLKERPEKISVSWTYPQGGGIVGLNGPAPESYIIHISTIPDGFGVVALQPKDDTSKTTEKLQVISGAVIDPITNLPLRVYGGLDDLLTFSNSDDARAPKLYLSANSNTPLLDPSELDQDGDKIFGKSFIVGTGFFDKMAAGTPITALLDVSELPKTADIIDSGGKGKLENIRESSVFYIRVRGTTLTTSGTLKNPVENARPIYQIGSTEIRNIRTGVVLARAEVKKYTKPSSMGTAKIPSEKTLSYQKAVQTALVVMLLCRVSLPKQPYENSFAKNTYKEGGETGLENLGRPLLQKYDVGESIYKGNDPWSFRKKIEGLASFIQAELQKTSAPPDSVLESLEDAINTLNNTIMPSEYFEDPVTLLECLSLKDKGYGIGANPFCRGSNKKVLKNLYLSGYSFGPERSPSFQIKRESLAKNINSWVIGMGSADYSPIMYNDSEITIRPVFVRNWFLEDTDGQVMLEAAQSILGVAGVVRNPKDGNWIAVRFMPQALPEADAILEKLEDFLEGILDSLEGIVDKIIAIIESIQARIFQLQAILEYIKSLLESILNFALPGVGGLVLVEDGTAGLAGGLVSSGNKPVSSPVEYSAGVVAVAGGLPTILLDILAAIFSGGGE